MAFRQKIIQLSKEHFFNILFFFFFEKLDINGTTVALICFYGNVNFEMIIPVFKQ